MIRLPYGGVLFLFSKAQSIDPPCKLIYQVSEAGICQWNNPLLAFFAEDLVEGDFIGSPRGA